MDENMVMTLTAQIVSAHVSNNEVSVQDLPALINTVRDSLLSSGYGGSSFETTSNTAQASTTAAAPSASVDEEEEVRQEPAPLIPAVSPKRSVFQDYIICLEDGKKMKMLKRHLSSVYNLTPDEYRAKWGLREDYPMVAPSYAARRSSLAKEIGLGRKPKGKPAPTTSKLIAMATGRV